jgi:hypothetical protein
LENIPKSRSAAAQQERKDAIKAFQSYARLAPTGELDEATRNKMLAPRCGAKDTASKTRGAFVSKWDKQKLTWALVNPTPQLRNDDVRRVLNYAFRLWTKYVPLDITEVSPQADADIKAGFGSRNHGDYWPFDGPGVVLAHATYPKAGLLHFDDEEKWSIEPKPDPNDWQKTNLFWVAIHEMGHALGLPHLNQTDAIMYPYYNSRTPEDLTPYDVEAIQNTYGARPGVPTPKPVAPTQPTQRPPQPGNCEDQITYCNDYIKQCNTEPWMRDACPKSCRFCR